MANWPIRVGGIYKSGDNSKRIKRVTAIDGDKIYYELGDTERPGHFWDAFYTPSDTFRRMATPEDQSPIPKLVEALKLAEDALRTCYNVTDYPADGETKQDDAMRSIRAALALVEGV